MPKIRETVAPVLGPGATALQLAPHVSAQEAAAVFQRKVPSAEVELREVCHPFWWVQLQVHTRGLFPRKHAVQAKDGEIAGTRMHVLVNAHSGRSFIADFNPAGEEIDGALWNAELEQLGQERSGVGAGEAQTAARALVRTKVVKTVKLGMRIDLSPVEAPRAVLKPNWVVTGANKKFAASFLVDGLDGTHYVIRAKKL